METTLLACETIEDEVHAALKALGIDPPVIWLAGGLHNSPDGLRERVQEILDAVRCQRLIVCLGYCGGGLSGLRTGDYQTILPLADDCLSLMLGSMEARRQASRPATYFMTAGWLRHENNLVTSYHRTVERYGRARADRLNRLLLRHYRRIGLVSTGCYDLADVAERVKPLSQGLDLVVEPLDADPDWLRTLLAGPYDDPERFLVVAPGSLITFDDWCPLLMGGPVAEYPPVPAELPADPWPRTAPMGDDGPCQGIGERP